MDSLHIQLRIQALNKYPAKKHAKRVADELGVNKGLIYLLGQYAYTQEDSDQPKTWRQRRYFYYCSGVDEPNACLTYDIATEELVLYIEIIDPTKVVWQGRGSTIEEAYDQYDVDVVRLNPDLFSHIDDWVSANPETTVYILHPDHKPDIELPNLDSKSLFPAIDAAREIKDHHEIDLIKQANSITAEAHGTVLSKLHRFRTEADVQALFEAVCTSNFAKKQSYPVIAGSGENASVLHYTANNEGLAKRQLLLIDAGAEWQQYAADVTRTFPISGYFTTEAEKIYKIVENMQDSCVARLKAGAHMWDLHVLAAKIALKGLVSVGVLRSEDDLEEMFSKGTYKGFYPHGLGHHVGLEVHDIIGRPILRYKGQEDAGFQAPCRPDVPALKTGMVVTIEPGIYFNRYELNRAYLNSPVHGKFINKHVLEKYWAVGGVRIEDDYLITEDGYVNLTTAPKGEEALNIIRDGRKNNHCMF